MSPIKDLELEYLPPPPPRIFAQIDYQYIKEQLIVKKLAQIRQKVLIFFCPKSVNLLAKILLQGVEKRGWFIIFNMKCKITKISILFLTVTCSKFNHDLNKTFSLRCGKRGGGRFFKMKCRQGNNFLLFITVSGQNFITIGIKLQIFIRHTNIQTRDVTEGASTPLRKVGTSD